MTIYLSRQYNLSVDLIGYAMTVALTIGVVFSLGFGILADKFDKNATCCWLSAALHQALLLFHWCITWWWWFCFSL